jgi:hypothetical protein
MKMFFETLMVSPLPCRLHAKAPSSRGENTFGSRRRAASQVAAPRSSAPVPTASKTRRSASLRAEAGSGDFLVEAVMLAWVVNLWAQAR